MRICWATIYHQATREVSVSFVQQDFIRRMPEASRYLRRRRSFWQTVHLDPTLLLLLLILTIFGLVLLYSASEANHTIIKRQLIYFVIAYLAMITVAQIKLNQLSRWSLLLYLGTLILLIAVFYWGTGAKGAQRWLSLGGFRFQPSEMMKLAMPIAIAAYLSNRSLPPRFKDVAWTLALIAIPTVLIIQQPDLGTAIMVAASAAILFFSARST